MTLRLLPFLFSLTAAQLAAQERAKPSALASAALTVKGEHDQSKSFDIAALAKLPQREVRAEAHGKSMTCDGSALIDVVAAAGAPQGEALRGKQLNLYVKVSARDGYSVVYSLAELDPAMRADVPILAAHCNGAKLDDKEGPFRVIYPGEKRAARWIRQVISIEILRAD